MSQKLKSFQEDWKNSSGKLPIKKIVVYIKMERICHKCGRDYSNDPFWTSKLRRQTGIVSKNNLVIW